MAGSAKTAAAQVVDTPSDVDEAGPVPTGIGVPATAAPASVAEPGLARGTVAKGRTVYAPTLEQRLIGHTTEGKPVHRFVEKAYGPGQEVTLPEAEILHLRRAGFLVDPNAAALAYGNGPNFDPAK